ncbi:hypothetical protein JXA85_05545, partial [Candidatus Woesearchaeota archaeon]|nr:hypothetical protein [Candidatus Woesearchaeota archaeon]
KIMLTRENCQDRKVEAKRNRTVTAVFPWRNNYVAAVGPTARFLGKPGPSCFIAYAHGSLEKAIAVDLNFPFGNENNMIEKLTVRTERDGKKVEGIDDEVYRALKEAEREVLVASISGLEVEVGDPYCNPKLAQIPEDILLKAGLPSVNIEAYFANGSKPVPALKSYVAPSKGEEVTMSGALYGAFPVGTELGIDMYGKVKGDMEINPTLVHVIGER